MFAVLYALDPDVFSSALRPMNPQRRASTHDALLIQALLFFCGSPSLIVVRIWGQLVSLRQDINAVIQSH